jgi:hypothetical protein
MPVLFNKRTRHLSSNSTPRVNSAQAFHRAESTLSRSTSKNTCLSVNTLASAGGGRSSQQPSGRREVTPTTFTQRLLSPKRWLALFKRIYRERHLKYLLPLVFISIYMLVGAVVFYWLENGADERRLAQRNEQYNRHRLLLVKRIEEIARDRAASRSLTRRKYVEEAVNHFQENLGTIGFDLETQPAWSFLSAMYFSGTIFTTIGYGDIACSTTWGRIATVIYAIVGIPIMLITLNDLGKFLYKSINDLMAFSERQLDNVRHLIKPSQTSNELDKMERGASVPEERHVNFHIRAPSEELPLEMEVSTDNNSLNRQPSATPEVIFHGGGSAYILSILIILRR